MLVSKIYEEDHVFKNADDAIKYMHETNFKYEVAVYDINADKAYEKTKEIYAAIKEYNKGKKLNGQILPSYPFAYRGIVGCLGVQCYSISLGTYERNRECISLFTTGWNDNVLDTFVENRQCKVKSSGLSLLIHHLEKLCCMEKIIIVLQTMSITKCQARLTQMEILLLHFSNHTKE